MLESIMDKLNDIEKRLDAQDNQLSVLQSAVDPLQKKFEDQGRDLEKLSLDMKVVREHGRRQAGIGPYQTPTPSDTETDGNGHSSYPWKQRPATPRAG
jgi:hypothetical protein